MEMFNESSFLARVDAKCVQFPVSSALKKTHECFSFLLQGVLHQKTHGCLLVTLCDFHLEKHQQTDFCSLFDPSLCPRQPCQSARFRCAGHLDIQHAGLWHLIILPESGHWYSARVRHNKQRYSHSCSVELFSIRNCRVSCSLVRK